MGRDSGPGGVLAFDYPDRAKAVLPLRFATAVQGIADLAWHGRIVGYQMPADEVRGCGTLRPRKTR